MKKRTLFLLVCVFCTWCSRAKDEFRIPMPAGPILFVPSAEVRPRIQNQRLKPLLLGTKALGIWAPDQKPLEYIWVGGLIDLFGGAENFGVAAVPDAIELVKLKPRTQFAVAPSDFIEEEVAKLSDSDVVYTLSDDRRRRTSKGSVRRLLRNRRAILG